MNVDVSPDGRQIVFDLLGDIYTMPIAGSGASAGDADHERPGLRHAAALQPGRQADRLHQRPRRPLEHLDDRRRRQGRASRCRERSAGSSTARPGRRTATTSSRAAIREGALARRRRDLDVSTPAGPTGCRSPSSNGFQKDAGEPAVSPDGRYLYYSKDVTPGQTFEYNKDPNGTIYAIIRRDLATGRERRVVSVQGGSVTPRVVARRQVARLHPPRAAAEQLFVRDLETGRDRGSLRAPRQGSAGGVGDPRRSIRSTPGRRTASRSSIWGEGKIWRVDVATAEGDADPVHRARRADASTTRVRFPQKVYHAGVPGQDAARRARRRPTASTWSTARSGISTSSPLPGGERPSALTTDDDASSSIRRGRADGQWIVYTTWTDAELRPRARHQAGRHRRPRRGHEAGPLHRAVVLARRQDDRLPRRRRRRHPRAALRRRRRASTSCRPTAAAPPRLVREGGTQPQFDHTGTRVYVSDVARGQDRARSASALAIRIAAAGRATRSSTSSPTTRRRSCRRRTASGWRSRNGGTRIVAPFPHTGRPIDLGSGDRAAIPAARISRDAGFYLHWSGDSTKRLLVARTGALHARSRRGPSRSSIANLREARRAGGEGRATSASPRRATCPTARSPSSARASSPWRTARAGAARPPGVIENGTVVVEGNRITAIGPRRRSRSPRARGGSTCAGKTIMPGIIDVHGHVGGEGDGILAQSSWPLAANLAFGVTTSHDPSNDTETVFTNAELIRAGRKLGPRLFSTGTILYGAETPFKAVDRIVRRCAVAPAAAEGGRARSASRATTSSAATRGR